jgi:hypothetical protein
MNAHESKSKLVGNGVAWPAGTEMVAISTLQTYSRNARTHSRRQIKKIARSIERFGFVNPVLIDENNMIIAGHGRVAAAKLLGWSDVPTLGVEHLNEAEKRAYIIADNRLAKEAGWNQEMLAIELQGLIELDFSIELVGFDTAERTASSMPTPKPTPPIAISTTKCRRSHKRELRSRAQAISGSSVGTVCSAPTPISLAPTTDCLATIAHR